MSCCESTSGCMIEDVDVQDVDGAQQLALHLTPERRWRVNCDMRCNRRQPCQLMYEMVAVFNYADQHILAKQQQQPDRHKASSTAKSSRQLMCQSSRSPVQNPEAACPLRVEHQTALEAFIVTNDMPRHLF